MGFRDTLVFGIGKIVPDYVLVQLRYFQHFRKFANLKNPQTFNEKLNWLKLYYHKPLFTRMVDKYEAKKYVEEKVGKQYVVPNIRGGVWHNADEIDFNKLPDQFVIKTNHDCGGVVVCKDKSTFDADAAREKLNRHLATNYYLNCREWPYKNVKRKIFAEVYFDSIGAPDSIEYKTTCFNGKVGFVTICKGIAHSTFDARSNDHYDVKFKHMPWYAYYKNAEERPEKPEQWDELISVCEKLSEGIPYLRVDSYIIDGQIYIGELTFYTWGGFVEFTPPEWDRKLGKYIKLPDGKNKKGK